MGIELCQLTPEMVKVNQPLKWDVCSAQGKLLLQKGFIILSEAQRESLLERGMYANAVEVQRSRQEAPKVHEFDPFTLWDNLRKSYSQLNIALIRAPSLEMLAILDDALLVMEALVDKTPDAAIFEFMQMDLSNYVVAHNQQTAFLATLISKRLGWEPKRIRTLCMAAATMNIAALELHSTLSRQKEPMTAEQREAMRTHGTRGRQLLERLGVTDQEWLQAVEEHHPDTLPPGRQLSEMAAIIHHADVYLAKISPRSYRSAKAPNMAAKEMLQGRGVHPGIVGAIIKEIGVYPPGSYVKLANGETAIVARRGKQAHAPVVYSLSNGTGMPLGEPILRDTGLPSFAISTIVPKSKVMVTINRTKLFGTRS